MKAFKGLLESLSIIVLIIIIANHWLRIPTLDWVALILFAIMLLYYIFTPKQHKWQLFFLALLAILVALLIFI